MDTKCSSENLPWAMDDKEREREREREREYGKSIQATPVDDVDDDDAIEVNKIQALYYFVESTWPHDSQLSKTEA